MLPKYLQHSDILLNMAYKPWSQRTLTGRKYPGFPIGTQGLGGIESWATEHKSEVGLFVGLGALVLLQWYFGSED